jgi:hypothetical protein
MEDIILGLSRVGGQRFAGRLEDMTEAIDEAKSGHGDVAFANRQLRSSSMRR